MQQRNLIWFMVLSLLILIGWAWLQNAIWPPKAKLPQNEIVNEKVDWIKVGPAAAATNLIANRGLALGCFLDEVVLSQDLHFTPSQRRPSVRWQDLTEDERKIVSLLPPIGVLAPINFKMIPEPVVEDFVLGSKESYLQCVITTRGAGVRKMTLNKFQAANYLGQPVKDELLELIQDDPEKASFLMFHYPFDGIDNWEKNPVQTLGRLIWKLEHNKTFDNGTQEICLSTEVPEDAYRHLRIFKTFRLAPRDYHFTLILEFQDGRDAKDPAAKPVPFRYQLAGAHGLPIEGFWYAPVYRDGVIGMVDARGDLYRTKEEAVRVSAKKGGDAVPDPVTGHGDSWVEYAGVVTQFFGSVIVVDNDQPPSAQGGMDMKKILRWARPTSESIEIRGKLTEINDKYVRVLDAGGTERRYVLLPRVKKHLEDAKIQKDTLVVVSYYDKDNYRVATWIRARGMTKPFMDDQTVRVNSEIMEMAPGKKIAHQFLLYHGPVKTRLLGQFEGDKAVDPDLVERYTNKLHLRTLTDYRSAGPFGTFSQAIHFTDLLIAVTNLMHTLLYYLHFLVGNYGLTIILLTILVRGLMFPISRKQAYFSVKMQEIGPELKKIKEKHPTDRQAQTQATMELYRKHNVHPLGSCLPLLMQMPIFLGLYYALQESIHFRLAGFLWIDNLAAPDMLVWWTEKIPWVSDPDNLGGFFFLGPFLNILPLFAVGFMIVQQKIMTPPPADEQQEMQQKMMKYMMAFMGIMFYKVASGLCLYFISTSIWGLAERKLLPKKKPALDVGGQVSLPGGKPMLPLPKGKGLKGKPKKEEKTDGAVQKVKDWWADVLKQAKKK